MTYVVGVCHICLRATWKWMLCQSLHHAARMGGVNKVSLTFSQQGLFNSTDTACDTAPAWAPHHPLASSVLILYLSLGKHTHFGPREDISSACTPISKGLQLKTYNSLLLDMLLIFFLTLLSSFYMYCSYLFICQASYDWHELIHRTHLSHHPFPSSWWIAIYWWLAITGKVWRTRVEHVDM